MKTQTIIVLIVFIIIIIIIIAGILILKPFSRDSGDTKMDDDVEQTLLADTAPAIQMNLGGGTLTANQVTATAVTGTGNLCIGSTCINEDHIKMLKGEADVWINANGPTGGVLRVDDVYDSGRNVYYSTARGNDHNSWRLRSTWP